MQKFPENPDFSSPRNKKEEHSQDEEYEKYVQKLAEEAADAFMKETPPSPLMTPAVQRQRIIAEFKERVRMEEQGEALERAFQVLKSESSRFLNDAEREVLFAQLEAAAEKLVAITYEETMPDVLYPILGMTQDGLHAIDEVARGSYLAQRYQDASALYVLLTTLNSGNSAYWHRLGISYHEAEDYPKAVGAYSVAHALDPSNIASYLYAAECCLNMRQKEQAEKELSEAKRVFESLTEKEEWQEHLSVLEKLIHGA